MRIFKITDKEGEHFFTNNTYDPFDNPKFTPVEIFNDCWLQVDEKTKYSDDGAQLWSENVLYWFGETHTIIRKRYKYSIHKICEADQLKVCQEDLLDARVLINSLKAIRDMLVKEGIYNEKYDILLKEANKAKKILETIEYLVGKSG